MRAFVIDAFTDVAFAGNPAGVVLLDGAAESSWMQDVAAELKHSETAFVQRRTDGAFELRWFTPAVEVDLCGHATLASTHALHTTGVAGPFVFHTRSGELRTSVDRDGVITLDFPAQPPHPVQPPDGLTAALGIRPVSVHGNGVDVLVEVADAETVAAVAPDFDALGAIDCRGVTVTAAGGRGSDEDCDFVSRFFAPRVGVPEDPVTGSAHCALAPFWAARLGRRELRAAQLSARGGRLDVVANGDRVLLRGRAVTIIDGELRV